MLAEIFYNVRDFMIGPNVDERRIVPRVRCSISLSCQTPQGGRVCVLRDLSACGARLSTDGKWRKGDQVQLLPPRGFGPESKPIKATVMWSRPVLGRYQCGLKFRSQLTGSWVGTILTELGLNPALPKQRRNWVRFPGDVKVQFTVHGSARDAVLKNLSLGGALIASEHRLRKGIPVQLNLPAGRKAASLNLVGTTCGSNTGPDGDIEVSIKFNALDSHQKKALIKHLSDLLVEARRS